MEAIDLLKSRRSVLVKNLTSPGPNKEELKQILEVGLRVPDHGKIGPWRIQVITTEGQEVLGDLAAKIFANEYGERATEKQIEAERLRPQRAPMLLVVTSDIQSPHRIPELEQRLSGGAVCMNLLNAAYALGYSAQWVTEWLSYDSEIKAALGHDDQTDIIGMIYIGTALEPPQPRSRPPLDEIVSEWSGL